MRANHSHDERESSSKLCHGCFHHKLYPSLFCSRCRAFLVFLNSLLHTKETFYSTIPALCFVKPKTFQDTPFFTDNVQIFPFVVQVPDNLVSTTFLVRSTTLHTRHFEVSVKLDLLCHGRYLSFLAHSSVPAFPLSEMTFLQLSHFGISEVNSARRPFLTPSLLPLSLTLTPTLHSHIPGPSGIHNFVYKSLLALLYVLY